MEIYLSNKIIYQTELNGLNKKFNILSFLRLISVLLFLIFGFFFIKYQQLFYILLSIIFLVVFIALMRIHTKLNNHRKLKEALISINQNEIQYLNRDKIPFENGAEFNDFNHPYAYDLDVYGDHSLFQNLNRTFTFIGKKTLAKQLLTLLPNAEIIKNQDAIKELAAQIDWRQDFMALAKTSNDTAFQYNNLLSWSRRVTAPLSKATIILSFLIPSFFLLSIVAYFLTKNVFYLSITSFIFIFNLMILGQFYKKISLEINNSENIDSIIKRYSLLVEKIEKTTFTSQKLKDIQSNLYFSNQHASFYLKQLSGIFSKMDTINNFVANLLFNGTFLFHVHTFRSLIEWKKKHISVLENWLNTIGEIEMLSSLANLSFNNQDFDFPKLNEKFNIEFTNLSHPLLNPINRIGNNINFQPQNFMILTGSNMSGKSTFLRSLGINMVLTGIGSAVCASSANVHPLPVLVSMRLSDSLSDSESYFYAEIKRLKLIMDQLEHRRAFVLLDEILRGTNSDDKRNGTIEVVKKMITKKAVGVIATHDIEVCLTTNEFPDQLSNKCFEVEIANNDLHFDYKLRSGICQNRSATFLMEKMGVI